MPMSPRLLRPVASGVHPEASAWRSAVVANGGSVSATTMRAVSKFCADIDAAGIRDRFYRLSLMCGNSDASLIAPRVPLYRGPSRTGTQYGNALDTNSNFVQGDYAETGASGGLTGNGTNKSLNTGFAPSSLPDTSRHLAVYIRSQATGTFTTYLGCRQNGFGGDQRWYVLWALNPATTLRLHCLGFNATADIADITNHAAGFYQADNDATAGNYYFNGAVGATADTGRTPATGSTRSATIFVQNNESGLEGFSNGRLGGYSMGEFMTPAQTTAYYNAMQAFQTALGRQV